MIFYTAVKYLYATFNKVEVFGNIKALYILFSSSVKIYITKKKISFYNN